MPAVMLFYTTDFCTLLIFIRYWKAWNDVQSLDCILLLSFQTKITRISSLSQDEKWTFAFSFLLG